MTTRRDLLMLLACGTGALLLPLPARAKGDGSYDVSYLWSPDLDAVLDYRDQVAELLGPDVASELAIVQGKSGNWGLIYDRKGTDPRVARKVAAAHDRLLRASFGGSEVLATAIADTGYTRSYNISYAESASLAKARERFDRVARLLGPDILRKLVVEPTPNGRYAVVYKRHGDADSTAKVAEKHTTLLKSAGMRGQVIPERHTTAVWGAGSTDGVLVAGNVSKSSGAPIVAAATVAPAVASAQATQAVLKKSAAASAPSPTDAVADRAKVPPPSSSTTLPAAVNTPIRDAINEHVQTLRRAGKLAPDETTSWYVHALHDDRTWVAINAERSLQCASMVKPFVALAFLHRVGEGRIIYGSVSKAKLEAMLQRSSNSATNWAMSKVGGPVATQRLLKKHYPDLVRETHIVEAIPPYGRTYKNRSSARDYVRFCRALWKQELGCHKELKRIMSLPSRDRLVTGAPSFPAGTQVLNKTGSTSHLCGDFGIIVVRNKQGEQVPYAFVGIIEKRSRAQSYGAWIAARSRVIRSVSDLTYTELRSIYDLV
ncbi:MAG: hypothetical protein EA397_04555 [Deltaproteobacteria bacterium]|nr:MAG: hypothetical protein EA397_04555 [Deltaproteobacteria bacterium]